MRIWNSTERLLACLRGEIPDRIPISTYELVGWNSRAWAELDGTRGLPMINLGDPLCEAAELFSLEDFVIYAMTETERIVKFLNQLHERYLESLRRILRGPVKNALFRICGPEYAAPPFLPPSLFAKFVTPYDGQYIQMIKEAGGWPRLHIHGRIAEVLAEIQKMGPDAIDPIEPPPDGDIDLAILKNNIGGQICLMGGIELKHLEARDGEFVEQHVRELILAGKPGGRFVIMPTAAPINIPLSPKTEANYFRWIEAALEAGQY